jgi:large subunit ribosomal protein L24
MKLKINDRVKIIAGKDKGKTGKITKVLAKDNKVVVEGANKYKRHMKRQSDKQPGGIIEIERPLAVAKVMPVCPSCKQITRIGYAVSQSGEKTRICKKCSAPLIKAAKKK